MAKLTRFEDMDIWQDAREIAKESYRLSQISKDANDFELMNALPKTSGSIMDNISEGFGRGGNREFIQFLSIAHASCTELKSQLYRFSDRPYCKEEMEKTMLDLDSLKNRINGFMSYLKKSEIKGHKFKEDQSEYNAVEIDQKS
jgi:four helix bundle protein